jgi:hypothetical protein
MSNHSSNQQTKVVVSTLLATTVLDILYSDIQVRIDFAIVLGQDRAIEGNIKEVLEDVNSSTEVRRYLDRLATGS